MHKHGLPLMLVGPESDQYALLAGQMREIRVLREFTHPNEDYPDSKIQSPAGLGLIKAELMAAFQRALPHVLWLDIENAMCDSRSQKSAAEPNRISIREIKSRLIQQPWPTGGAPNDVLFASNAPATKLTDLSTCLLAITVRFVYRRWKIQSFESSRPGFFLQPDKGNQGNAACKQFGPIGIGGRRVSCFERLAGFQMDAPPHDEGDEICV